MKNIVKSASADAIAARHW